MSNELEDYYTFQRGNTYNISLNDINIGNFVFQRFDTYPNCHFLNKGNNTFVEFDNLSIRLDEIDNYEINLIKESDYIDSSKLINGTKYLIGSTKENAKYYTVVSKYSEGYYVLNHENNQIQKFMYLSFVNYKVFKNA
jgi:hypothetical protein